MILKVKDKRNRHEMIDPRMADRRRTVLEAGARRGVRRALWLLLIVAVLAASAWLLQSPLLSVAEIEVSGSARDDVMNTISLAGLEEGTPLVMVRPRRIEEALVLLPWVRGASVERVFPDRVEIAIDQRQGVAWLWSSGTYAFLDLHGVVLEYDPDPPPEAAILQLTSTRLEPGEVHTDSVVVGGLEFAAAMGESFGELEVREEAGELWATVEGHEVRLGRSVDMEAKASALMAVLTEEIPPGSSINLIAPARPAVTPDG